MVARIYFAAMLTPTLLYQSLADPVRLRCLLLLAHAGELCVCEVTESLRLSQPMVSRHLGVLRRTVIVDARRNGQWVHYRLHPSLPAWARAAIRATLRGAAHARPFDADRRRLRTARRPAAHCRIS